MSKLEIIAEPGVPHLETARDFKASPELLLRAHVEPDLLKQWMGPRRLSLEIPYIEAHDGGRWRFVHRDEEGNAFGFRGVFHGEPSVADGVIQTFEFEGAPGAVSLQTLTFEPLANGMTRLRSKATYLDVAHRDAEIEAGMEGGLTESYDRLEELVAAEA